MEKLVLPATCNPKRLVGNKFQDGTIDTVTLSCWWWAVIKDMA